MLSHFTLRPQKVLSQDFDSKVQRLKSFHESVETEIPGFLRHCPIDTEIGSINRVFLGNSRAG